MDPVDVLSIAGHAAQLIRSGGDPEETLTGAYVALNLEPPDDGADALPVRIARLVNAAQERREALFEFLSAKAGPLPLNRPKQGWSGAVEPAMAADLPSQREAEELLDYIEAEVESPRDVLGEFPSFSIAKRRIGGTFGGRTVVVRGGKRIPVDKAGDLRAGDALEFENEGLPTIVRGLIDYPLERPCLFEIRVGDEPWSIWDLCTAFADQYARIYESPTTYGVWGHDLSDLWIEKLLYFPEQKLLYPHIGS